MKWLIFLCTQMVATSAFAAPHNPLSANTAARAGNPADSITNGVPACPVSNGTVSITTAAGAVASARTAWQAAYGKTPGNAEFSRESTARFEPYTATLKDGLWVVRGSVPSGFHGNVVESRVCASDGSVAVNVVAIP
jgi:hypothetical protein